MFTTGGVRLFEKLKELIFPERKQKLGLQWLFLMKLGLEIHVFRDMNNCGDSVTFSLIFILEERLKEISFILQNRSDLKS